MSVKKARPASGPASKPAKNRSAWKLKAAIIIGIFIVVALIGYLVVMPRIVASYYQETLEEPTKQLNATFKQLQEGTDRTTELAEAGPRYEQAAKDINKQIQIARTQLNDLDEANASFVTLPLVFANNEYEAARIENRKYRWMAGQSRAVLGDYERLVEHLSNRARQAGVLKQHLNEFNMQTDLNRLVGQGALYQSAAEDVEQAAAALDALGPLPGTPAGTAQSTATYRQAAQAFRDLARGLNLGSDAVIYAAAAQLEAVTKTVESQHSTELIKAVQDSATIREVRILSERLETVGS